jgi:hypothetical protein
MQITRQILRLLALVTIVWGPNSYAQKQAQDTAISAEHAKILLDNEHHYESWLKVLETPGVQVDGNQMIFSDEAKRLMADSSYRNSVYKESPYTFMDVSESLSKMEIQKAFWQLLDQYPENKEQVVTYIYAYDATLPSDKVLTAAFYTYAFFDPKITTLDSGKPVVHRPDIFEEYLRRTQEIVAYIAHYRKEAKGKKS